MLESTIAEATIASKAIKPGVFNGMLKQWQLSAHNSLIHAGLDTNLAHKVCLDYASDMGRMMASDGKFKSKIGKLTDDGERSITMAGKATVVTSNPMSIVFVAQTLDNLFKEELLATRKMPALATGLTEYLDICSIWVGQNEWIGNDGKIIARTHNDKGELLPKE